MARRGPALEDQRPGHPRMGNDCEVPRGEALGRSRWHAPAGWHSGSWWRGLEPGVGWRQAWGSGDAAR